MNCKWLSFDCAGWGSIKWVCRVGWWRVSGRNEICWLWIKRKSFTGSVNGMQERESSQQGRLMKALFTYISARYHVAGSNRSQSCVVNNFPDFFLQLHFKWRDFLLTFFQYSLELVENFKTEKTYFRCWILEHAFDIENVSPYFFLTWKFLSFLLASSCLDFSQLIKYFLLRSLLPSYFLNTFVALAECWLSFIIS